MNVLSLFDGISCGYIALERAGIKVDNYYSSEIDKYAIQVSNKNYPNIIRLGSVTGVTYESGSLFYNQDNNPIVNGGSYFTNIDLLIGGSPCQGFSFAGKQLNFNDPRSKLFFDYVRLLNQVKPKYFILENVNMKKEYQYIISSFLGVQPVSINSSLVSAQNRVRLYWVGKLNPDGTYSQVNISQPEDKGIMLEDIIEHGCVDREKSFCLDANYYKGGNLKQYFEKHRRQLVFGSALRGRLLDENGKRMDNKVDSLKDKTTQRLELRTDGKSNCLTTVSKDSLVSILRDQFPNIGYRNLTVKECCRLQTVPDTYFDNTVSNSRAYRALGNGWTVDVIVHILNHIKEEI